MVETSPTKKSINDLARDVVSACSEIIELLQTEDKQAQGDYNRKYMEDKYEDQGLMKSRIALVRTQLFERAINGDMDACIYVLNNYDETQIESV